MLTHASVLKVTADGTRTSPILRGKWVLEKIIGKPSAGKPHARIREGEAEWLSYSTIPRQSRVTM